MQQLLIHAAATRSSNNILVRPRCSESHACSPWHTAGKHVIRMLRVMILLPPQGRPLLERPPTIDEPLSMSSTKAHDLSW